MFVEEAAGAVEQLEMMDVGGPFRGHVHGHDRGRVDATCLLDDRVHARPQEVGQVLDPVEVP